MANPFNSELEILRGTPRALAAIPPKLNGDIATIRGNEELAESYKQKRITQLQAAAIEEIAALQNRAQVIERGLRRKIDSTLAGDKLTPEAATAKELAAGRIWQRAVRLLDSGQADALTLIHEAADQGDLATLQTLREELPSYLRAKDRADISNRALALIDQLETPLLTPAQQAAKAVRLEVERGMPQLNFAVDAIRETVTGRPAWNVIPDWAWKETIDVQSEGGQQ